MNRKPFHFVRAKKKKQHNEIYLTQIRAVFGALNELQLWPIHKTIKVYARIATGLENSFEKELSKQTNKPNKQTTEHN